jgi:hypothetical protein
MLILELKQGYKANLYQFKGITSPKKRYSLFLQFK